MELLEVVTDIATGLAALDAAGSRFRDFQPGVGPFGEPQLVKQIATYLNTFKKYGRAVRTKRCPDLLIPNEWAIEVKITRPYGDNGKEAENGSVNLLHPYRGNTSSIGDCYKLASLPMPEGKAVLVIGYEHAPAKIDLTPLVKSFETIATCVAGMNLGPRVEKCCRGLIHPFIRRPNCSHGKCCQCKQALAGRHESLALPGLHNAFYPRSRPACTIATRSVVESPNLTPFTSGDACERV